MFAAVNIRICYLKGISLYDRLRIFLNQVQQNIVRGFRQKSWNKDFEIRRKIPTFVEISGEVSSDRLPDWGSFRALPTLPLCSLACKNVQKKRLLRAQKLFWGFLH